jgi:hypothetical protein
VCYEFRCIEASEPQIVLAERSKAQLFLAKESKQDGNLFFRRSEASKTLIYLFGEVKPAKRKLFWRINGRKTQTVVLK